MIGRILTIAPYSSKIPNTGGTRRIHFINRGLAEVGWQVFQHSFAGMGKTGPFISRTFEIAPNYVEHRHINPLIAVANRVIKEFGGPQVAPLFMPRIALPTPLLREELKRCDVVMFEHPHYYEAYRSLIPEGKIVVHDSHNIESRMSGVPSGAIARAALEQLYQSERRMFREADISFTCTEEDRARAISEYGASEDRIVVAPNGTDTGEWTLTSGAERAAAREALGLGNGLIAYFAGSRWGPNTEAVDLIIRIAGEMPEVDFLIAGTVGQGFEESGLTNLHVLGFVEDLKPYLQASDIALNPMVSGGGSNIKLFDYLSAGLPVISTPFGTRGCDDPSGEAITVAEIEAFPAAIGRLQQENSLASRRQAARELAIAKYDWRAISAQMSKRIEEAVRQVSSA